VAVRRAGVKPHAPGRHWRSDEAIKVGAALLNRLATITHRPPSHAMDALMLEGRHLKPALPAPFVSTLMRVEPGWIDYNGHLNMAYYNVLFDRAVDEVYELLGLGLSYVKETGHSTFTAEVHVRYLRELLRDAPVRVTFQLLDFDEKRMHYFEQLHHAEEGWLSATSENMALNVDMTAKKVTAFPDNVMAQLAQMKVAHDKLPMPDGLGRRIEMRGRPR
jgi:acyl-CoA thioester hydrolase